MEVESGAAAASKDTNRLLRENNATPSSSTSPASARRKKICLITVGVVLAIILIVVILSLTVLKAKDPKITPNSIALDRLSSALDLPRLRVDLNVTIRIDLNLKNPNVVGMKYKNTTALIYYRDELVGEVPIPQGKIGAHDTKRMNVTLLVLADRLVSNPNTYNDVVVARSIGFTTVTRISGKVKILNMFSISVSATSTCVTVIDIANQAVSSSACKTKM
uniref:Late embryogenesis abundant protein LEA-2 subgroup domain-containing protein n=1 Tax=Kalanchoe fedtschenkoi TaxID=63787 RepID=A0A7N0U9G3_KALFE